MLVHYCLTLCMLTIAWKGFRPLLHVTVCWRQRAAQGRNEYRTSIWMILLYDKGTYSKSIRWQCLKSSLEFVPPWCLELCGSWYLKPRSLNGLLKCQGGSMVACINQKRRYWDNQSDVESGNSLWSEVNIMDLKFESFVASSTARAHPVTYIFMMVFIRFNTHTQIKGWLNC